MKLDHCLLRCNSLFIFVDIYCGILKEDSKGKQWYGKNKKWLRWKEHFEDVLSGVSMPPVIEMKPEDSGEGNSIPLADVTSEVQRHPSSRVPRCGWESAWDTDASGHCEAVMVDRHLHCCNTTGVAVWGGGFHFKERGIESVFQLLRDHSSQP